MDAWPLKDASNAKSDDDIKSEFGDCPLDVVYEIVAEQSSREPALLDDGWVRSSVVVAYMQKGKGCPLPLPLSVSTTGWQLKS